MGKFLKHTSCPKCGSKDNLAIYADGGSFCFTPNCNYYSKFTQNVDNITMEMSGTPGPIKDRRITEATCKKYGVTIEYDPNGNISKHHYPYYHSLIGDLILVKTRYVANMCHGKVVELINKHIVNVKTNIQVYDIPLYTRYDANI